MMMAAMAAKGKGKGKEDILAMLMEAKGKGKGAQPESTVFKGEGNTLGSGDSTAAQLQNKDELSKEVRPVDTSQPTFKLRVRLLNRKVVEVEVNQDFTVRDLRTFLEHHHSEAFDRSYHLMDGASFPPKKLDDPASTLESLGLTKKGASVECRPA